jgi:hypothetical protein
MNMKRFLLLSMLVIFTCSSASAQQVSHDELIEILGIRSWRVPVLKAENWEWTMGVVDYVPRKFTNSINSDRLSPQKKALIVWRSSGGNTYQYMLKQPSGTIRGERMIGICSESEIKKNECDNSYYITWYDEPNPYDDGSKFAIAEINHMLSRKPRKQIILEPVQFRQY